LGSRVLPHPFLSFAAILLLAVAVFGSTGVHASVTVVNESGYPWLVRGAYADYRSAQVGEPPSFIEPNGSVLIGLSGHSYGTVTLNWSVISREGNIVLLLIRFSARGCENPNMKFAQGDKCVKFSYNRSLTVSVNLTDGESYVNGSMEGVLNFWEPPLLNGGEVAAGTVFLAGRAVNIYDTVSSITDYRPILPVNVSGKPFSGVVKSYETTPTQFGVGGSFRYAWLNSSGGAVIIGNQTPPWSPLGPSGTYDYYNGLALQFEAPDYPVNQTVCSLTNGGVSNCTYTSYSTTLGAFFHVSEANMALVSTNVQLLPSSGQGVPQVLWLALASVGGIAVITSALGYVRLRRRETGRRSAPS